MVFWLKKSTRVYFLGNLANAIWNIPSNQTKIWCILLEVQRPPPTPKLICSNELNSSSPFTSLIILPAHQWKNLSEAKGLQTKADLSKWTLDPLGAQPSGLESVPAIRPRAIYYLSSCGQTGPTLNTFLYTLQTPHFNIEPLWWIYTN